MTRCSACHANPASAEARFCELPGCSIRKGGDDVHGAACATGRDRYAPGTPTQISATEVPA